MQNKVNSCFKTQADQFLIASSLPKVFVPVYGSGRELLSCIFRLPEFIVKRTFWAVFIFTEKKYCNDLPCFICLGKSLVKISVQKKKEEEQTAC